MNPNQIAEERKDEELIAEIREQERIVQTSGSSTEVRVLDELYKQANGLGINY